MNGYRNIFRLHWRRIPTAKDLTMKELINTIKNIESMVDKNAELQMNDELATLVASEKDYTELLDMGDIKIISH